MGSDAFTYISAIPIPAKEPTIEIAKVGVAESLNAIDASSGSLHRSDEILIGEISSGSREALSIVFRRYARPVFVLVSRILRDPSEAEDLVQDVFLLLFEKAKLFDSTKGSAASWILRIAYLRALDQRKYLGVRHHYTARPIEDERLYATQGVVSIDDIEGRRLLARWRGELTAEQRETLELHFFDGYTFLEIADRMQQSLGNVRNHYYRGLSRLRALVFTENSHSK